MDARAALAFVARRAGRDAMPVSHWANTMSMELRWMAPGLARRYVDACIDAALLRVEGDMASLSFDPRSVELVKGRPDPDDLPVPVPTGARAAPVHEAEPQEEPQAVPEDIFAAWLPKVAAVRGSDVASILAEVEGLQQQTGGLLHADAALLRIGAEAGLDVRDAAAAALSQMQA